ncbi:MAG: oligopeptide transporter, OPT family [Acidobacteriota bacterium]|nr:oligopeptide transporter, OPT family [Acidobacteriota bacterium]
MSSEPRKLPKTAYELAEGETYVPYTHGETYPEFTLKAIITGIFLGVLFGSANVYLGLKSGLTISTSIPVAVLSVVIFRALGRHNILETNMSQTIGSASSSVASGVLFTLPALFIWSMVPGQEFIRPELLQMAFLAASGGLLGVLAMVPLRRFLIKKEHGNLPYPEGMACAEVLVASEHGGKHASGVFWGIGVGILFKALTDGFKLIPKTLEIPVGPETWKVFLSAKISPALMGVGYILGLRIATVMVAGGLLSALIIIPGINMWGYDLTEPFYPETEAIIRDMSAKDIWNRYVRYIGAGAVAMAGFITLIQSIPAMVESFKVGLKQLRQRRREVTEEDRTDSDLSFKIVGMFVLIILIVLTVVPGILGFIDSVVVRGIAAVLIGIFAFFFVTVSSRIVGLVGVTSNPTSGMTIATLIGTSLIFYFMGWTDIYGKATALMVGTVVCIAASIAGDTSQDLKTGFILGATPRRQQIGELVGVVTCAAFICLVLILLHDAFTLGSEELAAPQATLMKLVIDGVLDQKLPWNLVGIGAGITLVVFALRLPTLPFAVGVYLPLSTMMPLFLGGLLRHFITRNQDEKEAERRREKGVLFGSGLVGGEGLTGVLLALWIAVVTQGEKIKGFLDWEELSLLLNIVVGVLSLAALLWLIRWNATRKLDN